MTIENAIILSKSEKDTLRQASNIILGVMLELDKADTDELALVECSGFRDRVLKRDDLMDILHNLTGIVSYKHLFPW